VAEGTPASLKHSVGHDVVVAEVEGDAIRAIEALRSIEGLEPAWSSDGTLTVNVPDGAAALGTVAVTLGKEGLQIKSLTMRTPTLDDVFMTMTGSRIEQSKALS
jgi:ABC-2 type transport system ATP-binding protein